MGEGWNKDSRYHQIEKENGMTLWSFRALSPRFLILWSDGLLHMEIDNFPGPSERELRYIRGIEIPLRFQQRIRAELAMLALGRKEPR